jgi:hypothetical protein
MEPSVFHVAVLEVSKIFGIEASILDEEPTHVLTDGIRVFLEVDGLEIVFVLIQVDDVGFGFLGTGHMVEVRTAAIAFVA